MNIIKNKIPIAFFLILLHFVFGFLALEATFSKFYYLTTICIATYNIIRNKNSNEEALLWACYFVGSEVFFRMTNGSFSYEMGKYIVMYILILGIFVNAGNQKISYAYFVYLLLLFVGILKTDVPPGESMRKAIAFNLSGPLVLFMSAFYFYRRAITFDTILKGFFYMLLPIFAMLGYIYFKTPDLKDVIFSGSANFATSGGFGPNQVSTILGLGIFILLVSIFLKEKITGYHFLDIILLMYLIYRALLTFSRGGLFAAVITFIIFIFYIIIYNSKMIKTFTIYLGVGGMVLVGVWLYTLDITGGMLNNRYTGRNASGVLKEDITSGRLDIFIAQFESFYETPWLGIGVGNGKYKRISSDEGVTAASHNEVTRLFEEHGALGFVILCILFSIPLVEITKYNNFQKAFLLSFLALWFLTINHSAMRIAFPGFIYGLSLINIKDYE